MLTTTQGMSEGERTARECRLQMRSIMVADPTLLSNFLGKLQ